MSVSRYSKYPNDWVWTDDESSDDELLDTEYLVCGCTEEEKRDIEHEDSFGTAHSGICLNCDCTYCADRKRNGAVPFCEWCWEPLSRPSNKPVKHKTFHMNKPTGFHMNKPTGFHMNKPTGFPKRNMKEYAHEFQDDSMYTGSLRNGKYHGSSKYCYSDNLIVLTGNMHYGKWSGVCKLLYKDEEIHGKFKKGKFVESYRYINGRYYGYFRGYCQGSIHGVDFELHSNGNFVIKRR